MEPDSMEAMPPPRQPRRWWVRIIQAVVLVYLGVVAIFFGLQAQVIFPGSATQGTPEAVVEAMPGRELVKLTTPEGERVVALFGRALNADGSPHADPATCPTMLYFYGNAMCLQSATGQLETFRRLGLNVMIPDYLGYGMSGGQPSEVGCRATAEACFAWLESRPDVDRGRIVIAGWSLGGAVAIDLASRHKVAGLATFSAFTSAVDMAKRLFPMLPSRLLLRHRFESRTKIRQVGCPVLIGHGRADRLIPFTMADELAAAANPLPVTRVTIDEADHNDFFEVGADRVTGPLREFILALPARQ